MRFVLSIVVALTVKGVLFMTNTALDVPLPVAVTRISSVTQLFAAMATAELAQVAVVPLP
jgi:hypothetical protein